MPALMKFGLIAAMAALAACQSLSPPLDACALDGSVDPFATVSMAANGDITVSYDPAAFCPPRPVPLIISRSLHTEVYNQYVHMVGGLQPGESRPLYRILGYVRMNEDRSLTYTTPGGPGPEYPAYEYTVPLGDGHYDVLLARVGGLSPGETRGVTTRPVAR